MLNKHCLLLVLTAAFIAMLLRSSVLGLLFLSKNSLIDRLPIALHEDHQLVKFVHSNFEFQRIIKDGV